MAAPRLCRRYPTSRGTRVLLIGSAGSAPHYPCLSHEFGFGKKYMGAPCCLPSLSDAVPVDSSDKTLAAHVHLRLLSLRLYGCGAHVCRNPGKNTRSTAGWAPRHFITRGGLSSADGVDSSDKTLAAHAHLRLLLLRLHRCGAHICKNPVRGAQSVTGSTRVTVTTWHVPFCESLSRPRRQWE